MLKTDFIKTIQSFIADGKTDEALSLLHQEAAANYPSLINDVTLIENRYQTAHDDFFIKGFLTKESYDSSIAKINLAILEVMRKVDAGNTQPKPIPPTSVQKNNGRLLHNIPEKMPLQKESKCIIRIAFDDEIIKRDLSTTSDTVIQSIKITEVMSVSLVDFNETPCFAIRTQTEAEQFIDAGEYTQWIFLVKPLKTGHYPLTLKVTVMEKIDGKERKRDIVLEKEIYILSQVTDDANKTASANTFTDTNIVLEGSAQKKSGATESNLDKDYGANVNDVLIGNMPVSEPAPSYAPPYAPPAAPSSSIKYSPAAAEPEQVIGTANKNWKTILTSVFALLVVAGAGLWVTSNSSSTKPASTDVVITVPEIKNGTSSPVIKESEKIPEPPPVTTDKSGEKKTKPDNSDIASAETNNKNKKIPTKHLPTKPTDSGNPSDVIAMNTKPTFPATEKLPNIIYAEPTVIRAVDVTKTGLPTPTPTMVKPLRPFLIQLNGFAKLKHIEIYVDGQLVKPNTNMKGEPVSMNIISHNGPHTILLKKGNKSCEYVDVLMVNDTATIEGCNLN